MQILNLIMVLSGLFIYENFMFCDQLLYFHSEIWPDLFLFAGRFNWEFFDYFLVFIMELINFNSMIFSKLILFLFEIIYWLCFKYRKFCLD